MESKAGVFSHGTWYFLISLAHTVALGYLHPLYIIKTSQLPSGVSAGHQTGHNNKT